MKVRDLAFMALRILSIYLFFMGLRQIVNLLQFAVPSYFQMINSGTTYRDILWAAGIPTLIYLMVIVGLWVYANRLSGYLVPARAEEADPESAV